MTEKTRLDIALFERGFAESREKAKALIAGNTVKPDDIIEVRGETLKYVSRGGLKLEKAVESFNISLEGCVCADIGASTGGFTDCMLQNGAAKVYSIDVGYGQLLGLDFSPIKGPEGNIEYLCFIEKDEKSENRCEVNAAQVVELSYKALER